eukprot:TRINITY_DN49132_c0_g1_i1.p1 TRINITY_DN49132_c0_g1~~TRINITY_DN49132_c0_g1_i1.p1  ORF type:complete len:731 (-),score=161.12 TRINITY_DN49132_c0_g1_i1:701-2893(-)
MEQCLPGVDVLQSSVAMPADGGGPSPSPRNSRVWDRLGASRKCDLARGGKSLRLDLGGVAAAAVAAVNSSRKSNRGEGTCPRPWESSIPKSKVMRLCGLGFSAAAVREALKKEHGNVERAGVWLLDRSNAAKVRAAEEYVATIAPLSVGCLARIGGLRAATHLNDVVVQLVRFEEDDQRWMVQPLGDGAVMAIRPRFLERDDAEKLIAAAAAERALIKTQEAGTTAAKTAEEAEAAEGADATSDGQAECGAESAAIAARGARKSKIFRKDATLEELQEEVRSRIASESGGDIPEDAAYLLKRLPRAELEDLLDGGGRQTASRDPFATTPRASSWMDSSWSFRRRWRDDTETDRCRRDHELARRDVGPLRRALAWLAEQAGDQTLLALTASDRAVGGGDLDGGGGAWRGPLAETVASAGAEELAEGSGGREEDASGPQQEVARLRASLRAQSDKWHCWEADQQRRLDRLETRESEAATRHDEWRALAEAEALQLRYLSERQSAASGSENSQAEPLLADPLLQLERARLLAMVRETEEVTYHVECRDAEMQEKIREREVNLLEEQAEQLWLEDELSAARRELVAKFQSSLNFHTRSVAGTPGGRGGGETPGSVFQMGRQPSRRGTEDDEGAHSVGSASRSSSPSSDEVWDLDWTQLQTGDNGAGGTRTAGVGAGEGGGKRPGEDRGAPSPNDRRGSEVGLRLNRLRRVPYPRESLAKGVSLPAISTSTSVVP